MDRICAAVQAQADADGELGWEVHQVDATVIRAHQHAAGAKTGDPKTAALGRSQGGVSTQAQLRAEGNGKPMTMMLTPGKQHEPTVFAQLMEQGAVKRPGRGRPKVRPKRVWATRAAAVARSGCTCGNGAFDNDLLEDE